MTISSFPIWFDWMEQNFEGQPLHVTEHDEGGATAYGWTIGTWQAYARLHGADGSFAHFKTMKKADFLVPTRVQFWNTVQGDRLPSGVDIIWADFAFGSGGATRVLQEVIGTEADGVVGQQTVLKAWSVDDRAALLDRMTAARKDYYATLSTYSLFGHGWDRRADECRVLAYRVANLPLAETADLVHIRPVDTNADTGASDAPSTEGST